MNIDNDAFKNFVNQDYSSLSDWLNTLSPYEFALVGAIIPFIIAPLLNANQQNSIGNFFEEMGQILLTIAAQNITVSQASYGNSSSQGFYDNKN